MLNAGYSTGSQGTEGALLGDAGLLDAGYSTGNQGSVRALLGGHQRAFAACWAGRALAAEVARLRARLQATRGSSTSAAASGGNWRCRDLHPILDGTMATRTLTSPSHQAWVPRHGAQGTAPHGRLWAWW